MKKNYSLVLIAFLCAVLSGYGQVTTIDFETVGDGYTPSTTFGTNNTDTFNRTSTAINGNNTFHWAAEDISGNPSITLDQIDVTGSTSFTFAVDLSYDNAAQWDATDELLISYSTDGGTSYQDLMHVQHINSDAFNNPAALDLDFNGNGDPGQELSTSAFITFTTSSITLSANTTLDIEFQFNNLTSNGEGILIDNIVITEVGGTPSPTITATPTSLTGFTYVEGGTSGEQSFNVSGTDLTNDITVTPPANWEISTITGGPYQTTAITLTESSGTVSSTPIYTRMVSGLLNVNSPFSGNIVCTSTGATTRNVAVDGTVTLPPPANDDCSGAISLTATSICNFVSYTNVNATDSGLASPSCQGNTGLDVWFSVVIPASGEITVETSANGGLTDTILALYSGTCGSLTEIACDDDGAAGASLMSLATASGLTVGSTVYIRVLDFGGNDDDTFDICVTTPTPCVAPSGQPTSLSLTNITSSSIDGSFTAITADEYLVVVSTSATLSGNPVDGTSYVNGDPLGGGTVVQSSNTTTFTATGLSQTTQYYFFVFALNDSSCAGGPIYNTTNPLTGNSTTITGPCLASSFENAESWSDHAYGNWTDTDVNGDDWIANGVFAGGGGNRRLQMNTLGNWIEFPPVDNPASLTYYSRISSSPTSANSLTVQYYNGSSWIDIVVHTSTSTTYELFTADLSSITVLTNVRLRLYRSADDRTQYIDDLSVYCGAPVVGPELQLIDGSSTYQNCGYTIDFGNVSTSTNSDITFSIQNIGNQPLDISSFTITGDYLMGPSVATTIATNGTQTFTVSFTPQSVGTLNGQLTIASNDSDEASCIIDLTGVGFIGVEEIRVETNSGNNIPDGAGIAPVYDNTFPATTEGQSSLAKTYFVVNEGTGDLDLNSITVSTTEFTITSSPASTTLAPTDSAPITIVFNPSTPGIKNATVTINNSDSDENPFTFAVRGTGLCGSGSMTSTPSSGPSGSVITLIDLSATISTATVTFNSIPLTTTVINANEIEVTIPNAAQTGNIVVTNAASCVSTFLFNVIDNQIGGCEGSTTLGEIFISEITDATYGGLSYVELYNATGAPINLSTYTLELYINGNTNSGDTNNYKTQTLSGTIGINQTFVITIGNDIFDCPQAGADGSLGDFESTSIGGINKKINEHDYLGLFNSGTLVDEFGVFGDDDWMDTLHTVVSGIKGFNFRRLNTATPLPNPSFDDNDWNIIDWIGSGVGSCSVNDYSNIGSYDFSTGVPPTISAQPSLSSFSCDITASISVTASEGFIGGLPLSYQWYYVAPGDTNWTVVTNNAIYSGVTTATLNISNALNLNNYQYYCEVRENTVTCYSASNAVRLNIQTTFWDGTNWSTPPTIDKIAIIDGAYDTSIGTNGETSFEACQLIVNTLNTLNIANNTFVRVQNNVTVNGNIVVKTDGSFVQVDDSAIVNGDVLTIRNKISVEKETAFLASYQEYTYWSSPVFEETVSNGLSEAEPNRIFWFNGRNFRDSTQETGNDDATNPGQDDIDDNANDWQYAVGTDEMIPGVGYASTHNSIGFTPLQYIYVFEGPFNNGVVTVPIFRDDAETNDNNWNFIGNPYPSAIDADDFLTANGSIDQTVGATNGAIFFWSHNTAADGGTNGNEVLNYTQSDYAIINGTGQTAGGDGVVPTRHIPSGQGFFVSMTNASSSTSAGGTIRTTDVVFNNSMRVNGNNNQFFRTSNTAEFNKIRLDLTSDNGIFNQILVGYVDGATNDDDGMYYDATRNLASNASSLLYSLIDDASDKKFAIQGKETNSLTVDEVIPLGFYTSIDEATLYKFSIAQLQGDFMNGNTVYLKDNLMNITHDLNLNDYTFTSETGEFNDRFEIVFQPEALSVNENELSPNDLTIIELGNGDVTFSVGKNMTIKAVEILDVLGRTIYNLRGQNSTETYNLSKLSQATYIARVTLSNGQTITKKAVKMN
jgi:hypothetical protein